MRFLPCLLLLRHTHTVRMMHLFHSCMVAGGLLLIPPCNHLVVNQSLQIQLFVVMMLRLRGFWGRQYHTFFDIRIFHPNASSYHHIQIASLFQRHELKKENMETMFVLLSLPLLHPWYFPCLVILAGRLLLFAVVYI